SAKRVCSPRSTSCCGKTMPVPRLGQTASPCVLSIADHTGYAHVVCVAAPTRIPVVVDRRRIPLIDPGLPTMPYHHETKRMSEREGNALIARVKRSAEACAKRELTRVVDDLAPRFAAVAIAIREAPFDELPTSVVTVQQSYQLQNAADGVMY